MPVERFYPVVDSALWVERLVPVGVRFIQLRIKDKPQQAIRQEIRRSLAICLQHGAELVVNDYWRLAIEEKAHWLHLGQEDLDQADMTAIRKAGLKLGVSTHDDEELERGLSLAPDYIALGPIYPTLIKAMRFGPQGLEKIGIWKRRISAIPLVAIGGMTLERAALCLEAGADSVSVVSDVLQNASPEKRCRDYLAAVTVFD